jgi:hypothetical protein
MCSAHNLLCEDVTWPTRGEDLGENETHIPDSTHMYRLGLGDGGLALRAPAAY